MGVTGIRGSDDIQAGSITNALLAIGAVATDGTYTTGDGTTALPITLTPALISILAGLQGFYVAENTSSTTFAIGAPVATDPSGTGVIPASAASTSAPCVGLAQTATAPTIAATVQTDGLFVRADWSAITGTVTLAPKAAYYLDPVTPGRLTATAPTTPGQIVQRVGWAISPDTLQISIGPTILL